MTFRRRLTLYGTAIAAVTTLVLWSVLLVLTTLGARGDQRTALEAASLEAASSIAATGAMRNTATELTASSDVAISPVEHDGSIPDVVVDGNPIRIPADTIAELTGVGEAFTTVTIGDHPVQVSLRRIEGGTDVVAAMQSRLAADTAVEELVPAMAIATVVILIAAYRASSVVARRAIAPLEQIASYSEAVRETGDASQQLNVRRRGREIDAVVASFNSMVTELARSRDRTAAALASQRRFVSDASHELRTPLTAIRTNAAFLAEHPDAESHDRTEALTDIISESERMSILASRLLDMARADADEYDIDRSTVDLGAIVGEIARQATSADRTVRAIGRIKANIDSELITRLLWILVDNALVHGGGAVTIEIDETPTAIFITVSDEGPGIPVAERLAVFERFRRVEGSTRRGSGLGLAMAKEIVHAHDGTISVDDSNGAVILVQLPKA